MTSSRAFTIGVDVGGTFTDVTVFGVDGRITSHKTPSIPQAPADAVIKGLAEAMEKAERDPADCVRFVHGSTIGVNTIIRRVGAKVGLLVTQGFEDVLELGRTKMADPFSMYTSRPIPLARKNWVRGIVERMDAKGRVVTPLDMKSLEQAARDLIDQGAEILAVSFINAYRNAAHEEAAKARLRELFPDIDVSHSSEIWPQVREYERTTVAVMNSYIAPRVKDYLTHLQSQQGKVKLNCPLYMTSSNGGVIPLEHARTRPINMLLSGPASGIIATLQLMRSAGIERAITMDIGGTSADLCVLEGDHVPYAWDQEIAGLPVMMPSVDVSSIGAGGGSIAFADNQGLLHVGPASAGADPGPVAYGRGGTQPTLTDAYVISGFIDPDNFLGGRLRLDVARARTALEELGAKMKLDVMATANGILQIATSNLVAEFTRLAANKGLDTRDFVLVPFGGAGATHACLVADELQMRRIAIPYSPGTFCAAGSILADFRLDYIKTLYAPLKEMNEAQVDAWIDEVEARAKATLREARREIETTHTLRVAGLRYLGQGYEVPIRFERLKDLPELFRNEYARLYGPRQDKSELEVISIRATVVGTTRKPNLAWTGESVARKPERTRRIEIDGKQWDCPVYVRAAMPPGWRASGPFIVDQPDTTCVVTPGWQGEVDATGTLHLRKDF